MTSRILKHRKGFTLVELVVVITIIGIIVAAGTLSYSSSLSQARDEKVKANVENIRISLELYKRNGPTQFYPDSLEILSSQGFEVPPHPVSNGLAEYVYTPLPTGCTSTTSCSTYEMRVPLEESDLLYFATPLSSQVISIEEITPTPTVAAWSTPIALVPTRILYLVRRLLNSARHLVSPGYNFLKHAVKQWVVQLTVLALK